MRVRVCVVYVICLLFVCICVYLFYLCVLLLEPNIDEQPQKRQKVTEVDTVLRERFNKQEDEFAPALAEYTLLFVLYRGTNTCLLLLCFACVWCVCFLCACVFCLCGVCALLVCVRVRACVCVRAQLMKK